MGALGWLRRRIYQVLAAPPAPPPEPPQVLPRRGVLHCLCFVLGFAVLILVGLVLIIAIDLTPRLVTSLVEDIWPMQDPIYIHARSLEKFPEDGFFGVSKVQVSLFDERGVQHRSTVLNRRSKHEVNQLVGRISYPANEKPTYALLTYEVGNALGSQFFLLDIYLKGSFDPSPTSGILAYFPWNAVVNDDDRILIQESTYSGPDLQDQILDKLGEPRAITGPSSPTLDWAIPVTYRAIAERGIRAIISFVLKHVNAMATLPLLTNFRFSLLLDVERYRGTPGFASYPQDQVAFSTTKFNRFITTTQGFDVQAFAKKQNQYSPKPWHYSWVDYTEFLMKQSFEDARPREVEAVIRINKDHLNDVEFGRLFVESLFCTQIHFYNNQTTKKEQQDWIRQLLLDAGLVDPQPSIFFLDYSELVGIPRNDHVGYFLPARVLLNLDERQRLRPFVISLYQGEYHQRKWVTYLPGNKELWQIAKLYAKTAAGIVHETITHAFSTHLMIEPFAVAHDRMPNGDHFLYRFLLPHVRYTVDVNFKARVALIGEKQGFDEFIANGGRRKGHIKMMANTFNTISLDSLNFIHDMQSRGFADGTGKELPSYFFADDALLLYKAIEAYCNETIHIQYKDDAAVALDAELQMYLSDVRFNGYNNKLKGFELITSRQRLVRVLTSVIHTASVIHAAINFPQFSHYSLVANSPLSMRHPIPNPGEKLNRNLTDYLPSKDHALKQIALTWGLSRFSKDELYLYNPNTKDQVFFNTDLWNDPRFSQACQTLKNTLQGIEQRIQHRGLSVYGTRYDWLLPSLIPTSIAT